MMMYFPVCHVTVFFQCQMPDIGKSLALRIHVLKIATLNFTIYT